MNQTRASVDGRPIAQVIYEAALRGATPAYFAMTDVDGWHTCNWPSHPKLSAVQFSDGSIVYVSEVANVVYEEEVSRRTHHGGESELKVTHPEKGEGEKNQVDGAQPGEMTQITEEDLKLTPEELAAKLASRKE